MSVPVIDPLATGRRIDELRTERGISRTQLAKMMGLASSMSVYKWSNGQSVPSIDNLIILASVFNTTLDDIVRTKK